MDKLEHYRKISYASERQYDYKSQYREPRRDKSDKKENNKKD